MGFQEYKEEIRKFVTMFVRTGTGGLSQSRKAPPDKICRTWLTQAQTCPKGGNHGGSFLRGFAFSQTRNIPRRPLLASVES